MNVMKQAHEATKAKIAYIVANGLKAAPYFAIFKAQLRQAHKVCKRVIAIAQTMAENVAKRCPWLDLSSLIPKAIEDCTNIARKHGVDLLEKQFKHI